MRKITSAADLKSSIKELELVTKRQEEALKIDAKSTVKSATHSFRPVNLIRMGVNTFAAASTRPDIRRTAINTFISLAAGFISRKLVVGRSTNIVRRTLGAALRAAIIRMFYKKLPEWERKIARSLPSSNTNRLKY